MDVTMTVDGKTYSIVAMVDDDDLFHLGVCEVAADGGPGRVIVDPDTTDEVWESGERCILSGVQMVI